MISKLPARSVTFRLTRRYLRLPSVTRSYSSSVLESEDIAAILAKPSWSVRSLLKQDPTSSTENKITSKQLHHLLRMSALPLPDSAQEEQEMIKTLESQLEFVKAIQSVDTEGIEPLQSIRDETVEAEQEAEITLETLKDDLAKEEVVPGRTRRIRRRKDALTNAEGAEDWDPLAHASKKIGRYFVVETGKD